MSKQAFDKIAAGLNEAIAVVSGKHPDIWPCGHPRTPENTKPVGNGRVQCRECRRAIDRLSQKKRHGKPPAAAA